MSGDTVAARHTAGIDEALVVSQHYRPEPIGTGPYSADLAETLVERGAVVRALTCRPHYPGNEVFPGYADGGRDREVVNGVSVARLATWMPRHRNAAQRVVREFLFLAQGVGGMVSGRIRPASFVLSVSPSILAVWLGAFATRPGGTHVALVHDIQSGLAAGLDMVGNRVLVRLMRRLEVHVLNLADVVLVLSEEMRRRLAAQGVRTRIEVLPIWIDPDRLRPVGDTAGHEPIALYSGNIGKKQALEQVISMAEELRRRGSGIRVVLRGEGSELPRLRVEAARRRLENVAFEPLVSAERLNEALADGDIHLVPQHPSAADFAVPSKIYAIMAAARPFVATARPGTMLWTLQQETGAFLCVPPGDPPAFAEAVLTLAGQPALRAELGARGRRYVQSNHARDLVLDRFFGLVAEAV